MIDPKWQPVVGFEGLYEVSDTGVVRSLDRIAVYTRRDQYSGRDLIVRRRHNGKILRAAPNQSGHLSVVLGRGKTRAVHVLVLEAFVGPCPDGCEGLHWNDDPANNYLSNLRWGTRSDNLHDAVRNGRKAVGDAHYLAKIKAADVPIIRREARSGRGSIARLARQFSVSASTIQQIRDGRTWRHIR